MSYEQARRRYSQSVYNRGAPKRAERGRFTYSYAEVVERFQEWQNTEGERNRIHAWTRYVDARDGLEPGEAAKVFYESQISEDAAQ